MFRQVLKGAVICLPLVLSLGCQSTIEKIETPSPKGNDSVQPLSPKAKPKLEPQYPSASQVIAWHASACGNVNEPKHNADFIGEQALKRFFQQLCLDGEKHPEEVMTQLEKVDQGYYWPDEIKQYLWLQKKQLQQQLTAQQQQQALAQKMQQTLSSLAAIEQQLLIRETSEEQ